MSKIYIGIIGLILLFGIVYSSKIPSDCEKCTESLCPKPKNCPAGIVKDRCGCCYICAQQAGETCDLPDTENPRRGVCGENLECRKREDVGEDMPEQTICYCIMKDVLCGTDKKTYDNICTLVAAGVKKGERIKVDHTGPCKSDPWIVTGPVNHANKSGANVFLTCEAKGYPIPSLEWTYTNVNEEVFYLPSDDLKVSVNIRGGPEKYMVTGWLQIMNLDTKHEGDYACVAQNEFGVASKTARINVIREN